MPNSRTMLLCRMDRPLDLLKNHVCRIRVGLIDPNANQFVTKKERIVSAVVRINILGPLQILFDNAEAPLNGVKLRNVLTILAFRANGEVLRDELIDELNLMETTSDAPDCATRALTTSFIRPVI